MKTVLEASVNDLLLNYVQAYVNWCSHPDSPPAHEDNDLMVAIAMEFKRREEMRERLEKENADLRKLYNEAMEQLNFTGDIENF